MSLDIVESAANLRQYGRIEFQLIGQNSIQETAPLDDTNIWQYIETVQPERQRQEHFCQKVFSTVIKIIVFTDTILTSLVPNFLSKLFRSQDIDIIEHWNEESFFQSINPDDSITHFIIINSRRKVENLVNRVHSRQNIQAMYLHCETKALKYQRRLARNYSKLDAVYDDSLRLLVKLIMDIALFCEETADRQKAYAPLKKAAYRNYQRSIDLYAFAETMV
ncbi:hypothetical protein I4U23_005351 [Adineta vaga]|nr:hypothetical protein I4U23_005351 [Adineta vaga]